MLRTETIHTYPFSPQLGNEKSWHFFFCTSVLLSPSRRHIVPLSQGGDDAPLLRYFIRYRYSILDEYCYNNTTPYAPSSMGEDAHPLSTCAVYNKENPRYKQQAQVPIIWREPINGGCCENPVRGTPDNVPTPCGQHLAGHRLTTIVNDHLFQPTVSFQPTVISTNGYFNQRPSMTSFRPTVI